MLTILKLQTMDRKPYKAEFDEIFRFDKGSEKWPKIRMWKSSPTWFDEIINVIIMQKTSVEQEEWRYNCSRPLRCIETKKYQLHCLQGRRNRGAGTHPDFGRVRNKTCCIIQETLYSSLRFSDLPLALLYFEALRDRVFTLNVSKCKFW